MDAGRRVWMRVIVAVVLASLAAGCGGRPVNPSLCVSVEAAAAEIERMADEPCQPERPVVVIGGLFDVGIVSERLGGRIEKMLGPDAPVVTVTPFMALTMEACRKRTMEQVQRAFPSSDEGETVEVDVVGFSLGGVIARDAAIGREGERRLKIKRLFTIASPHTGAAAAAPPAPDERINAIRTGSEFLSSIDLSEAERGYPIFAYVRLEDRIAGVENAGPRGEGVWWVANRPLEFAHGDAYRDPRILADIGRRLRGEAPLAVWPRTPLPGEGEESSAEGFGR